jgi:hypothetical protein
VKSIGQFLIGVVGWIVGQAGLLAFLPHTAQTAVQAVAAVLGVLGIRSAATAPVSVVDWLNHLGSGWKTVAGVLVAFVGTLLAPDVLGTLPPGLAKVVQVCGVVLTALGLYHASTKVAA